MENDEKWWEKKVVDTRIDWKTMGKSWEDDGKNSGKMMKVMLDNYAYNNFVPTIKQPHSMVLNVCHILWS